MASNQCPRELFPEMVMKKVVHKLTNVSNGKVYEAMGKYFFKFEKVELFMNLLIKYNYNLLIFGESCKILFSIRTTKTQNYTFPVEWLMGTSVVHWIL